MATTRRKRFAITTKKNRFFFRIVHNLLFSSLHVTKIAMGRCGKTNIISKYHVIIMLRDISFVNRNNINTHIYSENWACWILMGDGLDFKQIFRWVLYWRALWFDIVINDNLNFFQKCPKRQFHQILNYKQKHSKTIYTRNKMDWWKDFFLLSKNNKLYRGQRININTARKWIDIIEQVSLLITELFIKSQINQWNSNDVHNMIWGYWKSGWDCVQIMF